MVDGDTAIVSARTSRYGRRSRYIDTSAAMAAGCACTLACGPLRKPFALTEGFSTWPAGIEPATLGSKRRPRFRRELFTTISASRLSTVFFRFDRRRPRPSERK